MQPRPFVHLLVLALLLVSFAGCKKSEPATEPTPGQSSNASTGGVTLEPTNSAPETNPHVAVTPAALTDPIAPEPTPGTDPATPPKPAEPPGPAPKTAEGTLLRMKWPVGNRYVYRLDMEQHSTNQMPQTPEPARENVTTGVNYQLKVLQETPEGGRELEVELLAFDTEVRIGNDFAIHFDSSQDKKAQVDERPVPPPFFNVVGSKVRLRLDPEGKVAQVLGYDEWVQNVTGDPSGPARQMLVQQFNPGFFQQMADFGASLPPKPVASGESWPRKTELPAGELGLISLDSTITFTRWEEREQQKFAVIEAKGVISSKPKAGAPDKPSLWIEHGTVRGTSWFDPEIGALLESVVEQSMRMKGSAVGGETNNVAGFVSDIAQKVTVKLIESRKE